MTTQFDFNDHLDEAKLLRHQLKGTRAAFRLLEGTLLTGHLSSDEVKNVFTDLLKRENQIRRKLDLDELPEERFAASFMDKLGPVFRESAKSKYPDFQKKLKIPKEMKILIVEDKYTENGWEQVFGAILGRKSIVGALNKKDCLETLQNQVRKIAFIFLDLKLPEKEEQGLGVLNILVEKYPEIPVVIFSTTDSINYAKNAFNLGAWEYFPKEPDDRNDRNPIIYFSHFYNICKKLIHYINRYFIVFWKKISKFEELNKKLQRDQRDQRDQREIEEITSSYLKNLKDAYKFLILEDMMQFLPGFLNVKPYEEAIRCCSKALEIHNKLFIYECNLPKHYVHSFGSLDNAIRTIHEFRNQTCISEDWKSKAEDVKRTRNKVIHGNIKVNRALATRIMNLTVDLIDKNFKSFKANNER